MRRWDRILRDIQMIGLNFCFRFRKRLILDVHFMSKSVSWVGEGAKRTLSHSEYSCFLEFCCECNCDCSDRGKWALQCCFNSVPPQPAVWFFTDIAWCLWEELDLQILLLNLSLQFNWFFCFNHNKDICHTLIQNPYFKDSVNYLFSLGYSDIFFFCE